MPTLGADQDVAADDSSSCEAAVAALHPAQTTAGDEEDTNAVTAPAEPTALMLGGRGRPDVRKWTAALGADARRGGRKMMQGSMEPGLESIVSSTLDGQLGDRDEVDLEREAAEGCRGHVQSNILLGGMATMTLSRSRVRGAEPSNEKEASACRTKGRLLRERTAVSRWKSEHSTPPGHRRSARSVARDRHDLDGPFMRHSVRSCVAPP